MNFHVSRQSATLCKGLSTDAADIRTFPCVSSHMFFKCAFNRETSSTVSACERFLAAVHPHVHRQSAALIKTTMAYLNQSEFNNSELVD